VRRAGPPVAPVGTEPLPTLAGAAP